jgi:hypothetical protein
MDKKLYVLHDDEENSQSGLIIYDFFSAIDQNETEVSVLKYINSTNTDVIDRQFSSFDIAKKNLTRAKIFITGASQNISIIGIDRQTLDIISSGSETELEK